ncbi:MAG: single-stranded DNA-binding protein [Candidatus Paceibacterota bacterium]
MYLNKAIIIGNLTQDPELKSLPSGVQVTNFSLATNRVYNDKDGNKQESSEFHNIVVFGRQAETSAQYLKKGQQALVEGRLQTRSWEDQSGVKKYRTEIIADRVQFGQGGGGQGGGQGGSSNSAAAGAGSSQSAAKSNDTQADSITYPDEEINPDDIPF